MCSQVPFYRTIPTHVGRTSSVRAKRISCADHPHARGENELRGNLLEILYGPSPRTWGELRVSVNQINRDRTISTHVGRTNGQSSIGCLGADHPHARGENG